MSARAALGMSAKDKLAVALDTHDWEVFERWCAYFGPRVGVLKVGLEAWSHWGPRSVEVARQSGSKVFLDVKLHDIPNTVAGAVRGVVRLGVDWVNVHVGGGPSMLDAAVEAAAGQVGILGVTLLTHLDPIALEALALEGSADDRVASWTGLAAEAGCCGVVCSAREATRLRSLHPSPFLLVTPGIRPTTPGIRPTTPGIRPTTPENGNVRDDQRRTTTPAQAVRDGSDLLVVGRPLTAAPDPGLALDQILAEMSAA